MTLIVCYESLLCCHLIIAIIIVIENNCFVRKESSRKTSKFKESHSCQFITLIRCFVSFFLPIPESSANDSTVILIIIFTYKFPESGCYSIDARKRLASILHSKKKFCIEATAQQ